MSSKPTTSKGSPMIETSAAYRLFWGFAAVVFVINLLVMNDVASFWNGAEVQFLSSLLPSSISLPPLVHHLAIAGFTEWFGFSEFLLRLPSVFVTLMGFVGIYFLGRRIFGVPTIMDTLLVLGSSLLVVHFAKVATGDSWLFALLSLNFISLILYLKQNIRQWQIAHLVTLVLAACIHPLSAFVFSLVSTAYLYFLHPNGRHIRQLYHWLLWLILLPLFYFLDALQLELASFYLNYGNLRPDHYLLLTLIGMLPWTGFVWAGLWELIQKLRKKEEFAIITSAGLLAALFSQSLVAQTLLAIIVARQLKAYFHPNYPYKNIVQTAAILHLLLAIAAIIYLMIGSFDLFYLTGFRSAMAVGAVYWMPSLVAVIGLLGMNRRFIKGGMALSGLMLSLIFCLQLYPLVESQRSLAKRVAAEVQTHIPTASMPIQVFTDEETAFLPQFQVYLQQQGLPSAVLSEASSLTNLREKEAVFVVSDTLFQTAERDTTLEKREFEGWGQPLKEEVFWVLWR